MAAKPTRERLLDSAATLLREGGVDAVTMVAVARRADVSRQAVYLHFQDRTDLLVELVERVDKAAKMEEYYARVREAKTAAEAIEAWAEMQAMRNPHIAPLARELDARRRADPAAAAAWNDRSGNRMVGARSIVTRLAREGALHERWDADHAAILLWELTSFRVWDDLVNDAHLPVAAYVRMITGSALTVLGSAPRKDKKKKTAKR